MGCYDVPAMIDYILEKTGQTSLYYVGYSQGTTAFFVMASERPEYNAKVKVMACLAPIAFLSNHRSPLLRCVVPIHVVMKVKKNCQKYYFHRIANFCLYIEFIDEVVSVGPIVL